MNFFPLITFDTIEIDQANQCLSDWGHKMGPINRPFGAPVAYALCHNGEPKALAISSPLIGERVGNCHWMTRKNTIELSRLCAENDRLCRVALRLWREFVFPTTGKEWAVSYQDGNLHTGNTYRFDGWKKVGRSRSGLDRRSGLQGRDKVIWQWPPENKDTPTNGN